jgi:hypothetical protein
VGARWQFWWASLKEGSPSLYWVVGVIALITGAAFLAFVAFALNQPAVAGLILIIGLLLALAEGSYRIWFRTEEGRQEALEIAIAEAEWDEVAEIVGFFIGWGRRLASVQTMVEAGAQIQECEDWEATVRRFLIQAFNYGEVALFDDVVTNPKFRPQQRVGKRIEFLKAALQRWEQSDLSPTLDTEAWKKSLGISTEDVQAEAERQAKEAQTEEPE